MTEQEKNTATVGADNQTATQEADKGQNQEGQNAKNDQQPETDKIVLSKQEYDKQLQAETDRRTEQALKTQRVKWEKEYKERIDKERKDAERLAQLSADEREKELLSRQKDELSSKEKLLHQREMKLTAIDVMAERSLPVEFADQLIGEHAEDTHERIKKFESAWHKAIEKEVNTRLKGVLPRDGGDAGNTPPDMNAILRQMAGRQ